jgi:hypothetical protein
VRLREDWSNFTSELTVKELSDEGALDRLLVQSMTGTEDLQELVVSWMLEPFGDLIDGLTECMANPFEPTLNALMTCDELQCILDEHCGYATKVNFNDPHSTGQFWYVSEAKLEPRIGQRHSEDGADRESPLDITRRIHALNQDLSGQNGPIWQFLALFPQHRMAILRVQALAQNNYSEIRDNLVDADMAPIDMLRCKLSFFGASKFDPKSRLWTRITMGQGAPLASDLKANTASDDWWLPVSVG